MPTELITAKGTIKVNGEVMLLSEADITLSVGAYPKASIVLHENKPMVERVQNAATGDITTKLQGHQENMFEGRTSPDVELKMEIDRNGVEQTIDFPGFLTAPYFHASVGDFSYDYGVSHESATLSAFDSGIYLPYDTHRNLPLSKNKDKLSKLTNMKTFLKGVLDHMVENQIGPEKASKLPPLTQVYRNNILTLNETTKPYWDAVIEATPDSVWAGLGNLQSSQKGRIVEVLNSLYATSQYASFDSVRSGLESAFQLLYVPSVTEPYGKFVSFSEVNNDPENLYLDAGTLSIQTGSRHFLPTTVVAVKGLLDSGKDHRTQPVDAHIITWPETALPVGRVHEISHPEWMLFTKLPTRGAQVKGLVNLETYKDSMKQSADYVQRLVESDAPMSKILKTYARNAYVAMALGYSRSTLTVPMDLSLEVGKTYTVSLLNSKGNGGVFKGFLESVTHSMRTANNQGTASSILKFSHTQAGSFSLPGGDA